MMDVVLFPQTLLDPVGLAEEEKTGVEAERDEITEEHIHLELSNGLKVGHG
jgi:hypothetical protein